MNPLNRLVRWLVGSPIIWGTIGVVAFYALIEVGPLDYPLVRRYLMGHPVEYMEATIFAVGLAALIIKTCELAGQFARLDRWPLADVAESSPPRAAEAMLGQLRQLPASQQEDGLVRRLRTALEFVVNRGSAEGLGDELKYVADAEATRIHNSYGLFRVIVWAIPILGFLGTVIGITVALNSVDLNAPDKSMVDVLTGLGLKFDTTALALSLSMVLMFLHFFIDRGETLLLDRVDERVSRDMARRFPCVPVGPDGQLLVVRRMAETVVQASEQLVARQVELWRGAMDAAAARWTEMADAAGQRLQSSLAAAIRESLQKIHGESAAATGALQETVCRQVELLEKTVRATGEVISLEAALNQNLSALAGSRNFEQTVVSLAAAINLLSGRFSDAPAAAPIKLEPVRKAAHAA